MLVRELRSWKMAKSELLKELETMAQTVLTLSEMSNVEEIKKNNYSAADYTAGWQSALKLVSSYLNRIVETEYTRIGK